MFKQVEYDIYSHGNLICTNRVAAVIPYLNQESLKVNHGNFFKTDINRDYC